MIDCHCHLADEQFANDVGEVIERARNSGVKAVVVCAEFGDQFNAVLKLAEQFPSFCFPAIGIHPVQVSISSTVLEETVLVKMSV